MRFQVPSKTFRLDGRITQRIRQRVPNCRTGDWESPSAKSTATKPRNIQLATAGRTDKNAGVLRVIFMRFELKAVKNWRIKCRAWTALRTVLQPKCTKFQDLHTQSQKFSRDDIPGPSPASTSKRRAQTPPVIGPTHQFSLNLPAFPLFQFYETTTGVRSCFYETPCMRVVYSGGGGASFFE